MCQRERRGRGHRDRRLRWGPARRPRRGRRCAEPRCRPCARRALAPHRQVEICERGGDRSRGHLVLRPLYIGQPARLFQQRLLQVLPFRLLQRHCDVQMLLQLRAHDCKGGEQFSVELVELGRHNACFLSVRTVATGGTNELSPSGCRTEL